jgi:TonB family protein
MRRFVKPGIFVFCVALLASISVHLPIYSALGVLAEVMFEAEQSRANKPIFFEPVDMSVADNRNSDDSKKKSDGKEKSEKQQVEKVPQKEISEIKPEPPKEPEKRIEEKRAEKKPIQLQLVQAPPKQSIPLPPEVQDKLAVKQKSDDPNVPPPDNARFIAKENRRVEDEAVAIVRNMHRDDDNPSPRLAPGVDTGEMGDSEKSESADLEDREGSDERTATLNEAEAKPSRPSQPSAGDRMAPAVDKASRPGASQPSEEASRDMKAGSLKSGGEERAIVINDAMGTYRIIPGIAGRGPGDNGGQYREGAAAEQRGNRSGARKYKEGVNLNLSWSQYQDTFGDDELKRERESYLQQRRSKTRGGSNKRWQEFRAAIENFVSDVKPGNQTALNAAASPFAEYLSAVHRRIHREFAYRFLESLPLVSGPFSDMSLNATLEIVFNRDGTVHKIGFVKSSGFLAFDYGAFEAVMRAQPYPEPPPQILSGDGRVYVHWGFYRNHRQCGTFNASPYILPNPPGTPHPDEGPLKDPLGS